MKRTIEIVSVTLLIAITAIVAFRFVDFSIPPFEDAAMLMRYSDHLAHGHGIVWNIGEPPLDGATDFLFMVAVAIIRFLGFSIESSVRGITIASHFATVVLIYTGMRRVQRSQFAPAFLSSLYFAIGPGLFLSAAYFGTPFFAFGVALAWLLAQTLLPAHGRSIRSYTLFSLTCLAVGLTRPEGVLISLFMLGAVGVLIPRKDFIRLLLVFGGIFLLLGGAYFIWRWYYFGHPLPNPFYKKGGGQLYFGSLRHSLANSLSLGLPFIPLFLLAVRSRESLKKAIAFLIPILGSAGMWVLLSNEMNFGGRFQYPILVLCILSWYPLVSHIASDFRLPKLATFSAMEKTAIGLTATAILIFVFARHLSLSRDITYSQDGRYDIGVMLSQYEDRGYTIAATDPGLLSLYSRWRVIDTWGLNDQWIAHNGGLTYAYLEQQHPDIIMWHEYFSPEYPPSGERAGNPWFDQVMTLMQYAERNDFTLAAVFGTRPEDTHYYYVRMDIPEHDEIVHAIRSTAYYWYGNGKVSINFVDLPDMEVD